MFPAVHMSNEQIPSHDKRFGTPIEARSQLGANREEIAISALIW